MLIRRKNKYKIKTSLNVIFANKNIAQKNVESQIGTLNTNMNVYTIVHSRSLLTKPKVNIQILLLFLRKNLLMITKSYL